MSALSSRRAAPASALILAALVEPAAAHAPLRGVATFYAYALHPLLVPSHLLALTAAGLFLSQQTPAVGRAGVAALMSFVIAGLALAARFSIDASPEWRLLAVAAGGGALATLGRRQMMCTVAAACAVAGLCVGLDSAPDQPLAASAAPAYAGLMFGVSWIVTIIQGYAGGYHEGWPAIAKRVVGSWIFAISILTLSLALRAHEFVDPVPKFLQ